MNECILETFPSLPFVLRNQKERALFAGEEGWRELVLNHTIVSDVSRLNLDFLLCDDSLHYYLKAACDGLKFIM